MQSKTKRHILQGLLICILPLAILMVCITVARSSSSTPHNAELCANLSRLDSVIANHSETLTRKEMEIVNLRRRLNAVNTDSQRYLILRRLIQQYKHFDLDSASKYTNRLRQYALDHDDRQLYAMSTIGLARLKFCRGNEYDSFVLLNEVLRDTVSDPVRHYYYDFMAYITTLQGQNALPWYQRLDTVIPPGTADHVFNHVNLLRHSGHPAEALEYLDNSDPLMNSEHFKAIRDYLAADLQLELGDTVTAMNTLTRCAITDLSIPVRDYMSLYKLSSLLLARGDVERAYRYINLAAIDGHASKVLGHIQAVNELLPVITQAYGKVILRETRQQQLYVGGISLLAAVLIVALFFLWRSRNAAADAAALQSEATTIQTELNSRLNDNIRHQQDLNRKLTESNRVKEAYIMQYVNLCSYFLSRFDDLRESVATTAKTKGLPGIERLLAHADDDRELKNFYANFDSTFLKLFPDFVSQFNALLQPSCRIELRPDGTMTNELRTFSLIRLGITDSDKIASFLRRSVSTVYNYRVKMRNAALGNRDEFEAKVAKIG